MVEDAIFPDIEKLVFQEGRTFMVPIAVAFVVGAATFFVIVVDGVTRPRPLWTEAAQRLRDWYEQYRCFYCGHLDATTRVLENDWGHTPLTCRSCQEKQIDWLVQHGFLTP